MGGLVAEAMWWVGGTDSDNRASLSSNWTELDWTGTELGKNDFDLMKGVQLFLMNFNMIKTDSYETQNY